MRISVIIPVYNAEHYVKQTINSVLNQTFREFEVILVNDGSTDQSLAICNDFQNKDPRIKVVSTPNQGVSTARNLGINYAHNDWVALLDADDLWDSNYLEIMVGLIKDFPEAALIGTGYTKFKGTESKPYPIPLAEGFRAYVEDYFTVAHKGILFWTSATVLNVSKIKKIGAFNNELSMGEDLDLWFRAALHYKVAFYNSIKAHYRQEGENRAMDRKHTFEKSFLSRLDEFQIFEKKNSSFSKFINYFRTQKIIELATIYDVDDTTLKKYISTIKTEGLPMRQRIFVFLPIWLQRMVIKFKYNR